MICHAIIHRPRWGKSLFISGLLHYYDVSQVKHFEKLFGGLDRGIKPTPLKNLYYDLSLDLTLDVKCTMATAEIQKRLGRKVQKTVLVCKEFRSILQFFHPIGDGWIVQTAYHCLAGV
jgi:hypothetical protein